MGSSHHLQISKIVSLLLYSKPKSVLDIGTGFGKYGVLTKEYLGSRDNSNQFKVDGIEGHEEYVSPLHKAVYNKVFVGDANKLINDIKDEYDLVLLIDVLEHFDKENGKTLVQKALNKHKGILISTPKYVGFQAHEKNKFQQHKSQWSKQDLSSFGTSLFIPDPISHVVLISNSEHVAKVKKKYKSDMWKYRIGSVGILNWVYRRFFWKERDSI